MDSDECKRTDTKVVETLNNNISYTAAIISAIVFVGFRVYSKYG